MLFNHKVQYHVLIITNIIMKMTIPSIKTNKNIIMTILGSIMLILIANGCLIEQSYIETFI